MGSIPIERASFDGPLIWVIGKSGLAPQSGSNPVRPGNRLTTQFAFCLSFPFRADGLGYLAQPVEHFVREVAAGSNPAKSEAAPCPTAFQLFDGSQDWIIAYNARGRRFESGLRLQMPE